MMRQVDDVITRVGALTACNLEGPLLLTQGFEGKLDLLNTSWTTLSPLKVTLK